MGISVAMRQNARNDQTWSLQILNVGPKHMMTDFRYFQMGQGPKNGMKETAASSDVRFLKTSFGICRFYIVRLKGYRLLTSQT